MNRRNIAWILIFIVDLGMILWGAGAAIAPDGLLGPGGKAILPAGYEGYSGQTWASVAPTTAAYMVVIFRMYGIYCVTIGLLQVAIVLTAFRRGESWAWWTLLVTNSIALLAAITYDATVHAIGPFEVTEYLGVLFVWGACAITAPFDIRNVAKNKPKQALAGAALLAALFAPAAAEAQTRPTLHVSPRWKQCSIVLDAALTQAAWHQFTQEAAQVVYFRPLASARPMGRGKFDLSFMQWQTNVDDADAAWNDTFVHPNATHWLYEGGGLQFPGLAFRAGVTSSSDVGLYYTRNPEANYGAYGIQLQQRLFAPAPDWDLSARASLVSLFGPDDVDMSIYGVDVVASAPQLTYRKAALVPYALVSTYLSASHENSAVVNLEDESTVSVMATAGAELRFSFLRVAAEAGFAQVPSFAMKFGFAR
jgi:hypothetical protein